MTTEEILDVLAQELGELEESELEKREMLDLMIHDRHKISDLDETHISQMRLEDEFIFGGDCS